MYLVSMSIHKIWRIAKMNGIKDMDYETFPRMEKIHTDVYDGDSVFKGPDFVALGGILLFS